jgi:hypothetical protein
MTIQIRSVAAIATMSLLCACPKGGGGGGTGDGGDFGDLDDYMES